MNSLISFNLHFVELSGVILFSQQADKFSKRLGLIKCENKQMVTDIFDKKIQTMVNYM